jgi:hypothetical protein
MYEYSMYIRRNNVIYSSTYVSSAPSMQLRRRLYGCTVFTIKNSYLLEYIFENYVVLKDHSYKLLFLVHTG